MLVEPSLSTIPKSCANVLNRTENLLNQHVHCAQSLLHDTLRDVAPVSKLTCQEEEEEKSVEDVPVQGRTACVEDDTRTLLKIAHIPGYHYVECMLNIAFLRWKERLEWLRRTYVGMREQFTVDLYLVKYAVLNILFNTGIGKMGTSSSLPFYKARLVEVRKSGHTILHNFSDPSDPDVFGYVYLPFNHNEDADLESRTQVGFFQAVMKIMRRVRDLMSPAATNGTGKHSFIMPSNRWMRRTGKTDVRDLQPRNVLQS